MMKRILTVSGLTLAILLAFQPGLAEMPPAHAESTKQQLPQNIAFLEIVDGLERPVHITHAGDNSGRLFVVEQAGRIRILENGALTGTLLNINSRVRSPASGGGNEEGLLSMAFPPEFTQKRYFYVYYTNLDGDNQVSRFHLQANLNRADPDSEELVILFDHPRQQNHNGGQLFFGPDGYLYIGTGDGGGGGDPNENAQDPASLLGKLLRIDVEDDGGGSPPPTGPHLTFLPFVPKGGSGGGVFSRPYRIPEGNPFVTVENALPEIWALGLRNPWRFSFDRQTGDLWIGDVGQGAFEEIDFTPPSSQAGANYGWDILEGNQCFEPSSGCQPPDNYQPPVFTYSRAENNPDGCSSVTGGFVYRGVGYPALQGVYFFADFCSGKVWGAAPQNGSWKAELLEDTPYSISSFGEDQAGELYLLDMFGGRVFQIVEAGQ